MWLDHQFTYLFKLMAPELSGSQTQENTSNGLYVTAKTIESLWPIQKDLFEDTNTHQVARIVVYALQRSEPVQHQRCLFFLAS